MSYKKPLYSTGQQLVVADFEAERDYHSVQLNKHTKHAHTWGIAGGFLFNTTVGSMVLNISPGYAIDSEGRVLQLTGADYAFNLAGKNLTANADAYITISYLETPVDPVTNMGVTENTHLEDTISFQASNSLPADPSTSIILGTVTLNLTGDAISSSSVTTPERTLAGIYSKIAQTDLLKIKVPNEVSSNWPQISATSNAGALTLVVDSEKTVCTGDLDVAGNLTMTNTVPVSPDAAALSQTGNLDVTGAATFSENLTIYGNLTVQGSSSTANVAELKISDNIIRVNSQSPAVPNANLLGGLEVYRGSDNINYPKATVLWDEALLSWKFGTESASGAFFSAAGNATLNTVLLGDQISGAGSAGFSHKDLAGTSKYALMQSSDGLDTAVKTSAGNPLKIQIGGVDKFTLNADGSIDIAGEDTIENWISPALENGWVNAETPDDIFGYCKDSNNIVYLRGRVTGTVSTTIFTLPPGYRPEGEIRFNIVNNVNSAARLDVYADGQIFLGYGEVSMVSLDNVFFVAVQ